MYSKVKDLESQQRDCDYRQVICHLQGLRTECVSVGAKSQHCTAWVPIYWFTYETLIKSIRFSLKSVGSKSNVLRKCGYHRTHVNKDPDLTCDKGMVSKISLSSSIYVLFSFAINPTTDL